MGTFYEIIFAFRENVEFLSMLVTGIMVLIEIVGILERLGCFKK